MASGRKSGITLLEIIAVLAIVAVVAALTLPVFSRLRVSARQTHCLSNLRQAHLAISLYREENSGSGIYGSPAQMGLPPLRQMGKIAGGLRCEMPHPLQCHEPNGYDLGWHPLEVATTESDAHWSRYVNRAGDSAVLIYDVGHSAICPVSAFSLNKGLAVTLGGTAFSKVKRASLMEFEAFFE